MVSASGFDYRVMTRCKFLLTRTSVNLALATGGDAL